MLVLQREGEIVRDLPFCSALVQRGEEGDLAYATGTLLNYGGTDWFRTFILAADRFVLVVDRIHIVQPGLEAAHIEWNGLGTTSRMSNGFRLDQQGVFMDVTSDSGWDADLDVADQSADWKATLDSGAYPYASFPLQKLIFRMPDVHVGWTYCLATLLAATDAPAPEYVMSQPEPGMICVDGSFGPDDGLRIGDGDVSIRVDGTRLEVRYAALPDVPKALCGWSAAAIR